MSAEKIAAAEFDANLATEVADDLDAELELCMNAVGNLSISDEVNSSLGAVEDEVENAEEQSEAVHEFKTVCLFINGSCKIGGCEREHMDFQGFEKVCNFVIAGCNHRNLDDEKKCAYDHLDDIVVRKGDGLIEVAGITYALPKKNPSNPTRLNFVRGRGNGRGRVPRSTVNEAHKQIAEGRIEGMDVRAVNDPGFLEARPARSKSQHPQRTQHPQKPQSSAKPPAAKSPISIEDFKKLAGELVAADDNDKPALLNRVGEEIVTVEEKIAELQTLLKKLKNLQQMN